MKIRLPEIPRRAAAVAMALALIASIVSGVESPSPEKAVAAPREAAPASASLSASQSIPDLDLDRLDRPRDGGKVADLFASKAIAPPVPPAAVLAPPEPVAPPPLPAAPPLPFRYFGRWIEGERTVVFLWNNNEGYSAAVGDTLDGKYKVESMSDKAVEFVYLPLGSRQTLTIAEPN
jgi:hypothetical protein